MSEEEKKAIEEFEELFGNTPFENIKKIKEYINKNFVSKDKIRELKEKYKDKRNHDHKNQGKIEMCEELLEVKMRTKEVEEAFVKLYEEKIVLQNSIDKANYDEEYRNEIDLEDFEELKQAIDTVLNYIEELETGEIEKTNLKIAELEYKIVELEKENYIQKIIINEQSISKETLRKIKANTDTRYDFTEEVLKLL